MIVWEPFFHIGGSQLLLIPLLHKVTLALVERFSASRFWDQVRENGASQIHYLGSVLPVLLKRAAPAGGSQPWRPHRLGRGLPAGYLARGRGALRPLAARMLRHDRNLEHRQLQFHGQAGLGGTCAALVRDDDRR